MKIFASMPRLETLKGGFKELYVISIATDLRGPQEEYDRFISANNQPLDRIVPGSVDHALLKYYVMTVSNIYERIEPGQPVQMIGDGIILYPELDPKGLLGLDIFVVESDSGHRSAGRMIETLLMDATISSGVDKLIEAGVDLTSELVGAVAHSIVSAIPVILKNNHDDLLLNVAYSGRASRNYRLQSGTNVFTKKNHLIECDVLFDLISDEV